MTKAEFIEKYRDAAVQVLNITNYPTVRYYHEDKFNDDLDNVIETELNLQFDRMRKFKDQQNEG